MNLKYLALVFVLAITAAQNSEPQCSRPHAPYSTSVLALYWPAHFCSRKPCLPHWQNWNGYFLDNAAITSESTATGPPMKMKTSLASSTDTLPTPTAPMPIPTSPKNWTTPCSKNWTSTGHGW